MPTPNTDNLAAFLAGAFVVALIWFCFDLRAKHKQLTRVLTELRVDDEFDPDVAERAWLTKTHGVPQ